MGSLKPPSQCTSSEEVMVGRTCNYLLFLITTFGRGGRHERIFPEDKLLNPGFTVTQILGKAEGVEQDDLV